MRLPWDEYFMSIAGVVSGRATCDRRKVGCVMVDPARLLISTGYNGSPPGKPHCDDEGHEIADGHCVRTVHAEANAIAQVSKNGSGSLYGATCYSTTIPCYDCAKLLMCAGIQEVVFFSFYQSRHNWSDKVTVFLRDGGVKVRQLVGERIEAIMAAVQHLEGINVGEVKAEPDACSNCDCTCHAERGTVELPSSDGGPVES